MSGSSFPTLESLWDPLYLASTWKVFRINMSGWQGLAVYSKTHGSGQGADSVVKDILDAIVPTPGLPTSPAENPPTASPAARG